MYISEALQLLWIDPQKLEKQGERFIMIRYYHFELCKLGALASYIIVIFFVACATILCIQKRFFLKLKKSLDDDNSTVDRVANKLIPTTKIKVMIGSNIFSKLLK